MSADLIHYTRGREHNTRSTMAQAKFYEGYSRWDSKRNRYETWDEAVSRVMNMHRKFYADIMSPALEEVIAYAEKLYKKKYVLGAQRALQFGGDQIFKHHMRMYNCTSTYADRTAFFAEAFYVLLCGAGVGFSVQKHHVAKLPLIAERKKQAKIYEPADSIEGWADSLGVLMSSYFVGGGEWPEYEGRRVYFDLSKIREKGEPISGGFKAPGAEPLRKALDKIEHILQGLVLSGVTRLRPIHVYDIVMHFADAVLAGGVRRSATICLFSKDDDEMLKAKTGNWWATNPQRGRSNNSAVLVRDDVTKEEFDGLFKSVKEFGEPGFVFVNSTEHTVNPCVEIGMFPQIDGVSGWQGCNLTEINGAMANSREEFLNACEASAIIGTLQAGYTNFKYLNPISKKIFDREALLGCSITGWMNNPEVLFDEKNLEDGAKLILKTNKRIAKMIGINPAARATCSKPSGNASVLLETASGIHGEHGPLYLRFMQLNKDSEIAKILLETNPYMVEESVNSANKTDYVVAFPIIAPANSIYRKDLIGVNLLAKVAHVQKFWVENGTDEALCVDPTVRHNVSNTVSVKKEMWDEVRDFIYSNRYDFSGISLLSASGDKDYNQAPNTEIFTEEQIIRQYGRGAMFASGLIVDTFKGFDNLWESCAEAQSSETVGGEKQDIQSDWIRRFHKFANNYFDGDMKKAEYCLKDVYNLHKWTKIQQAFVPVNFETYRIGQVFTDIDTMGSQACVGGACEI